MKCIELNEQCPFCHRQETIYSVAILDRRLCSFGACPHCKEFLIWVEGQLLWVPQNIFRSRDEKKKKYWLINLGDGLFNKDEAEAIVYNLTPATIKLIIEMARDKPSVTGPITKKEIQNFLLDLGKIDDPEYFQKHFSPK